jgi:hypothetical protein
MRYSITCKIFIAVLGGIWFETVPSLLKGWFERVFTPGVAHQMDGYKITKYLKGKQRIWFLQALDQYFGKI